MAGPVTAGVRRAILPVAGGAVLLAGLTSTTFVDPDDPQSPGRTAFSAEEYVAESFPGIVETISEQANDLAVVVAAVEEDPVAAGGEYGVDLGSDRFVYRVTAVGEVEEVDADFATLSVVAPSGGAEPLDVRIPLGSALSGTPVRDATGTIEFGDFTDQNEYQSVANEIKLMIEREVLEPVDPPSLEGEVVAVTGAWVAGGPSDTFLIQPVAIEVIE